MRWIWDPKKAERNLKKHKVSFELAERALGDPLCLSIRDPNPDEERWCTLSSPSTDGVLVLFIVHTWPEGDDEPGRIISARLATAHERSTYEEG